MPSPRTSPRSSPPRDTDHLDWDRKQELGRGRFGVVYVRAPTLSASPHAERDVPT